MHAEKGQFDLEDVCRGISEKMKRRHPHVFGSARWPTARRSSATGSRSRALRRGRAAVIGPGCRADQPAGSDESLRRFGAGGAVTVRLGGLEGVLEKLQEELAEFTAAAAKGCGAGGAGVRRYPLHAGECRPVQRSAPETALAARSRNLSTVPQMEKSSRTADGT